MNGIKRNTSTTLIRELEEKIFLPPEKHRRIRDDVINTHTKYTVCEV
jgi:hypothetical protein